MTKAEDLGVDREGSTARTTDPNPEFGPRWWERRTWEGASSASEFWPDPERFVEQRRFQFVWWGFTRWYFGVWRPEADSGYSRIYAWTLSLGPVEVRRWR